MQCRRAAYSFVEVLFSIMILGIGFILVVAMIPVSAVQIRETVDQTTSAQVSKNGVEAIKSMADDSTMPHTSYPGSIGVIIGYGMERPRVFPIGDTFFIPSPLPTFYNPADDALRAWQMAKGRMINPADRRYAWTVAYSRQYTAGGGSANANKSSLPYAEVFIIVSKITTRELYTDADVSGQRPNLRLREVQMYLTEGTDPTTGKVAPDIVEFFPMNSGLYKGVNTPAAVAEGTFLIVADDQQTADVRPYPNGTLQKNGARGMGNGRVYRVGIQRPDLGANKWELAPGWDMASGKGSGGPGNDLTVFTDDDNQNMPVTSGGKFGQPAKGLILGRASIDPSNATEFSGPAQDVALFTTQIPILK